MGCAVHITQEAVVLRPSETFRNICVAESQEGIKAVGVLSKSLHARFWGEEDGLVRFWGSRCNTAHDSEGGVDERQEQDSGKDDDPQATHCERVKIQKATERVSERLFWPKLRNLSKQDILCNSGNFQRAGDKRLCCRARRKALS